MNSKDKNKMYTDNWRKTKGNKRRKFLYNALLEIGLEWKDAIKMRYWSVERINEWLKENGYDKVVSYEENN